jgi:hypothetical protein
MAVLRVRNWSEFQHYKDRSPAWIKLHKGLLDNYEYQRLPLASKALAPMLWLLASESNDGEIDLNVDRLVFRLRESEALIVDAIRALVNAGFLVLDKDLDGSASALLAPDYQGACLEERRDRGESIEEAKASSRPQRKAGDLPDCPYQSIVDLYAEKLPELPQVRVMDEKRKRCIKAFWSWIFTAKRSDGQVRAQTGDQALTWVGQYFERASANDFVMGRTGREGEHRNWKADIEYLCGEKGRKQVIERTVDA